MTLDLKETDKDAGVALRTGAPFSMRDMDEEWIRRRVKTRLERRHLECQLTQCSDVDCIAHDQAESGKAISRRIRR